MDDRIRVSDADRERVAERLREHYAEGRLTAGELDERISATYSAKTHGDLRAVLADLPEPEMAGAPGWAGPGMAGSGGWAGPGMAQQDGPRPPWVMGGGQRMVARRGPRLLPLVLVALIFAMVLPGAGFVFFVFLKIALLVFLVTCAVGLLAAARVRRHVRRHWQSGAGSAGSSWQREWHRHWPS